MEAIISTLIAGLFSLIGVILNYTLTKGSGSARTVSGIQTVASASQPSTPGMGTIISTPQSTKRVNFGKVLIHIGILQLAGNLMGFIIGFVLGSNGASVYTDFSTILVVGTIILIVGFYLFGISVDRAIMWKHLTYVSIGVVIVNILIPLLLRIPLSGLAVFIGLLQAFFAMGIGGSIARMRKPQAAAPAPLTPSYPQYHQQPPVPPQPVYAPTVAGLQPLVIVPPPPNAATQGTTWGYLAFSDGDRVGLTGKRIVVGRAKYEPGVTNPEINLSLQPEAASVSHMHAALENYGNAFTVTDLQSMNGTVVSGRRLEPFRSIPVNDGDTLYFGRVQCIFKKA
jgi:hypothetical protein